MTLTCFYSPDYAPPESKTFTGLSVVAKTLQSLPLVAIQSPSPINASQLNGLHSDEYLQAFLNGKNPLASSQGIPWTPNVKNAVLAMLGGQLAGANTAFNDGIAMNIAKGFHHSVYERGSGYCAINGLALVAHLFPEKRIVVLDCDEHGGNGTEEFSDRLPNLFNISIFGTRFGCRGGVRSWALQVIAKEQGFDIYMSALRAAEEMIVDLRPDLLIYQAGTDCHQDDPKNQSGLTTDELILRDQFVFKLARQRHIPILFVLAGGYQAPEKVAALNKNTVEAAINLFF